MIKINIHNSRSQSFNEIEETGHLKLAADDLEPSHIVINSTQCQVLSAEMPVKQVKQIIKALPFALEEQLANDIDENHILYVGREKTRAYALVLEHSIIDSYVQTYNPDSLQYLPLMLPITENGATVCILDGIASIRISESQAMSVSIDILSLVLEEIKKEDLNKVQFFDLDERHELLPLEIENIGFEISKGDSQALTSFIHQQVVKQTNNILSGTYAKKKIKSDTKFSKLKPLMALVATFLVVVFVIQYKEMKQYQQMGDLVKSASKDFYVTLFPDERVRSIKRQFRDKLEASGGATAASNGFINLLANASKGINSLGAVEWDAIRFSKKKNELELNLVVKNVAQLDNIKKKLTGNGLQVDIASATETGSKIKGVLKVSQNG